MLGKTHFCIGIGASLAVLQPQTMPALVAGVGAAAVGSVISDIDSDTSHARRGANYVITACAVATALVIIAESLFHVGIYERILRNSSFTRVLVGFAAFVLICAVGKEQPHRTFTHSFVAPVMLTACVGTIYPDAAPYFAVAFLTHLGLDLLNYKQVKLLWPMKKGYCLGVCSASGLVNQILMTVGPFWIAYELATSASAKRLAQQILHLLSIS